MKRKRNPITMQLGKSGRVELVRTDGKLLTKTDIRDIDRELEHSFKKVFAMMMAMPPKQRFI